jgi:phosphatidylglycerol lysyltransferase
MDAPLTALHPPVTQATKRGSRLTSVATGLVGLLALVAIGRLIETVRPADVGAAIAAIPAWRMAAAMGFTVASYVALTFYDWAALHAIGRKLPWRTAAYASFTGYALSHNLGFGLVVASSARWRAYSKAGLELADVARITLLASAAFWAGALALAGAALIFSRNGQHLAGLPIASAALVALGILLLGIAVLPFVLRFAGLCAIGTGRVWLPLPKGRVMAAQLLVAAVDIACTAAALFVLIPGAGTIGIAPLFLAYALAIVFVHIAPLPGGLLVFEASMLALVPAPTQSLIAVLLVYRLIYYILPLLAACALMLATPGERMRGFVSAARALAGAAAWSLAPAWSAIAAAVAGLVLMLSGALPPVSGRMHLLQDILPLGAVEIAHLGGSIVGVALILSAPALNARLKSGYLLALGLLLAGTILSLLKGFDFEEAGLMLLIAGTLFTARRNFYRRAGLAGAPVSDWWWAAAIGAVAFSTWIAILAYKHVPYSNGLWTVFAWHGAASRSLRATAGASLVAIGFSFWRLTSAPARLDGECALPARAARAALPSAERADAMLAFTGDKHFLASPSGDAFLMYKPHGRSWLVMGDPVGPAESWHELVWQARQMCDRVHARLCFYQASAATLPVLVELGLRPIKYGEEALVDLRKGFSLEGSRRKALRYSVKRAEAEGLRFEILPAATVHLYLARLRRVSDQWLARKGVPERCFSLGRFEPDYLCRFDCAILFHDDEIIAFANLWQTGNRGELSVDMMRYLPQAPYGTMDYLFVCLMRWGAQQGFERFNLGFAPLAGLVDYREAPFWSRAAAAVFNHGEWFYGFSGLRAFKQKFGPDWVPRYIAIPDGVAGWRSLIDLAAVVAK